MPDCRIKPQPHGDWSMKVPRDWLGFIFSKSLLRISERVWGSSLSRLPQSDIEVRKHPIVQLKVDGTETVGVEQDEMFWTYAGALHNSTWAGRQPGKQGFNRRSLLNTETAGVPVCDGSKRHEPKSSINGQWKNKKCLLPKLSEALIVPQKYLYCVFYRHVLCQTAMLCSTQEYTTWWSSNGTFYFNLTKSIRALMGYTNITN